MKIVAPDRIYSQYRDKPKAVQWFNITREISDQLQDAAAKVANSYDIDNNDGEQLNVIGRIVVQDRDFIANIPLKPYQSNADGDNECGDDEIQCSAVTVQADAELSDQYYRMVLKSKITKNNSDATIDDILDSVVSIMPNAGQVRLIDTEDMSFTIEFYGNITEIERTLLLTEKLIPKPQGVKFGGFLEGAGFVQCDDEAAQCGDETAQCVGHIGI